MNTIHVFYSEEDAAYIATLTELPTISGIGETPELALAEFRIAQVAALDAVDDDARLEPMRLLLLGSGPSERCHPPARA